MSVSWQPRPPSRALATCSTCYGYGLWAIGAPSPMGRIDAREGMPTLRCPECGADANPRTAKTENGEQANG